ncbi:hypothetical protein J0J30_24495, partial [Vibrio vulnificus]|nr:hypothetical protein [Vibrio vulnificus]
TSVLLIELKFINLLEAKAWARVPHFTEIESAFILSLLSNSKKKKEEGISSHRYLTVSLIFLIPPC